MRFNSKRPFSTPNPTIAQDNIDRKSLMGHSLKLQAWLNSKSVSFVQVSSKIKNYGRCIWCAEHSYNVAQTHFYLTGYVCNVTLKQIFSKNMLHLFTMASLWHSILFLGQIGPFTDSRPSILMSQYFCP